MTDTEFYVDLTAHEGQRLAAVLAAVGAAEPGWDPTAVLADETRAHEMLYAGLDAGQEAVLAELRAAGVLR
ncbi:MAG: DUF6400 family protein [Pseudonocardia sp.]